MKINAFLKYSLGSIIVIGIITFISMIFLIPLGLYLNLAYFQITGDFLGLEKILANLSKTIVFWILIITFTISTIATALLAIARPVKGVFILILLCFYLLATFGAIEIVDIAIKENTLYINIIKTIVYGAGLSSIMRSMEKFEGD